MTIAYFVTFQDPQNPDARISEADLARVVEVVRTTPKMSKGLVFTPEQARDPYAKEPPSPPLVLELYFADIADLEAAISASGHLQALAQRDGLPSLAKANVSQQAMIARSFLVPDPVFRTPSGESPCTYLVHYPGWADDLNSWLTHYMESHTRVMARFPGIREVEVCTRLDWCSAVPWPRVHYMQRNKVVFDSPAALTAALNSPVRQEMRADFARLPAFSDNARHYPMATLVLTP